MSNLIIKTVLRRMFSFVKMHLTFTKIVTVAIVVVMMKVVVRMVMVETAVVANI